MKPATEMKIEVLDTPEFVAQRAAAIIAEETRVAVNERGGFVMAVSGGHTPWLMLRELAKTNVPWQAVRIVQVDERVAPISAGQIYQMSVESADLEAAANAYAKILQQVAGAPPVLDLVHLGLGPDGHTASLAPGDPVLTIEDADVAITGVYQGRRRMTLTYPIINRSRRILWVVTGKEKGPALRRLLAGDPSIPAGMVRRESALVIADHAAAQEP